MAPGKAYQILVVCTGNICRSPVAETMLGMTFANEPRICVKSAGLNAPLGIPPDPLAIESALAFGFEVSPEKRSERLSLAIGDQSDLILVMEYGHKAEIRARFPRLAPKVFLLGAWNAGEIPDPVGKSRETFKLTAEQIRDSVLAWEPKIRATLPP